MPRTDSEGNVFFFGRIKISVTNISFYLNYVKNAL